MQIGHALQEAGLSGYDIEIMFQNGRCVLQGVVGTPQQRAAAGSNRGVGPGCSGRSATSFGCKARRVPRPARTRPYAMAGYQAPPGGPAGPPPVGPPGMPQVPGSDQPMPGGVPPMGAPIPATGPGPQSSGPAYDNPNLPQYGLAVVCPVSQLCRCDLSEPVQCQCLAVHRTVLSLSAGSPELAESDAGMVGRPLGPQLRLANGPLVVVPESEELVGRFVGPKSGKIGKSVKVCVL